MEALKRTMQYALIKNCDMNEEMRSDCVDAVISATEKCATASSAARALPSARAERAPCTTENCAYHALNAPHRCRAPAGTRPTTSSRRGR